MAQTPLPNQPWGGNLPCCHGPKDGCAAHNPNRLPVFWNPSLPSPIKPVANGFFKSLLTRNNDSTQNKVELKPSIISALPHSPSTLVPLPLIHSSVPYTFSLYHLHAITTSETPNPLLKSLSCHGITSSSPPLSWQVTPLLAPPTNTLLLANTYTLAIKLPHGAEATLSDTSSYSYQKLPLFSPVHNTYSFRVCSHATRHLRTLTLKVAKGLGSIRIEYSLKNVLGQEFKDEWCSEVGRQPGNMACGMCYTDFGMVFEAAVARGEVMVTVKVWKDLGKVQRDGGGDEKWEAARGGRAVKRDREDFGSVRRAFEDPLDGIDVGRAKGEANVDVSGGLSVGNRTELEDDEGTYVANGAQPPPPYTQ